MTDDPLSTQIKLWTSPRLRRRTIIVAVALVIGGLIDLAGTPLSLRATHITNQNLKLAIAYVVQARYDDCTEAEVLRAQNRAKVRRERAELPKTIKLLPTLNTPAGLKLIDKNWKVVEAQNAAKDCRAYARRARPPA